MKFVIVTLAVVFNLTLVVLYSRGLVGGAAAPEKVVNSTPVAERSASAPYKQNVSSGKKSTRPVEGARQDAKAAPEPVESRDGKETVDPKDGKELVQPVAEDARPLRLRSGPGRPSTEIMGHSERGILGPANRANVDPPVVSPEAR